MKNLLLASTALVAFAGTAAAELDLPGPGNFTLEGQGRFGVVSSNGPDDIDANGNVIEETGAEVEFSSRLRVILGMAFESDTGLVFGAKTRLDTAEEANNGTGGSVFVSGDFGKLQMGDVDSAAKTAVGNISGVGYTGIGDYNEMLYLLGGDGDNLSNDSFSGYALPAALYTFSTGDVSFYLGIGNPGGIEFEIEAGDILPDGQTVQNDTTIEGTEQYSVGVGFDNGQFNAGIGYESSKVTDIGVANGASATYGAFYIGGGATFGGATIKATYGDITDLDYSTYGASIDYTFDAVTATAFVRYADYGDNVIPGTTRTDRTIFGLGASYDLGGGIAVKGGVVDPDLPGTYYEADLGVTFNF